MNAATSVSTSIGRSRPAVRRGRRPAVSNVPGSEVRVVIVVPPVGTGSLECPARRLFRRLLADHWPLTGPGGGAAGARTLSEGERAGRGWAWRGVPHPRIGRGFPRGTVCLPGREPGASRAGVLVDVAP